MRKETLMKPLFVILVLAASFTIPSNAFAFWSKTPDWKLDTVTNEEVETSMNLVKDYLAHPDDAGFQNFWAVQGSQGDRYICGFVYASDRENRGEYSRYMFSVLVDDEDESLSALFFGQGEIKKLVLNICRERVIEE